MSADKAATWAEAAQLLLEELNQCNAKTLRDMGYGENDIVQLVPLVKADRFAKAEKASYVYSEVYAKRSEKVDGKNVVLRDHASSGVWPYSLNRPKIIAPRWIAEDGKAYWLLDYSNVLYSYNRNGEYIRDTNNAQYGDRCQEFYMHLIQNLPDKFWLYVPPFRTSKGSVGPYVLEKKRVNLFIRPPKGDLGDWRKEDFARYVFH